MNRSLKLLFQASTTSGSKAPEGNERVVCSGLYSKSVCVLRGFVCNMFILSCQLKYQARAVKLLLTTIEKGF